MTTNTPLTEAAVPSNLTELVGAVGEDPALFPEEKETIIRWSKDVERAHVFTEIGSVNRRLLRHPWFRPKSIRVDTETAVGQTMSLTDYSEGRITAVWGHFPIGSIKIQSTCRADQTHCQVVSNDGLWDI